MNKKEIIVDGWHVTDLPVPYTEKDYDEARAEIIAQAKNTPELGAVFEYGYIPALGISDMDFWVVFPDDAEKMYVSTTPSLSKKTKHVMMHETILIPEKHYKKMLYFDPWTRNIWPDGHRQLYKREDLKRDLNFEHLEFKDDEREALDALYIEEFLFSAFSLVPLYAKKELRVRTIFENIKSCVYIIREVNRIASKDLDPTFAEDFNSLRSKWFTLDQEEAAQSLVGIFRRGLAVSYEAAFILGDWISKNSMSESISTIGIKKTGLLNRSVLDKNSKSVYVNTYKDRRIYTDSIKTPIQAMEMSINSYKNLKINFGPRSKSIDFYINFLPLGMSGTILGLVSRNGLLSDNLKKNVYTNTDELLVFAPAVYKEKIRYINEITENYNRKQVPGTHGKGWPFGNNRFGYSFDTEKIRRKILTFWLHRKFWQRISEITRK